jgi:hypothetical protein
LVRNPSFKVSTPEPIFIGRQPCTFAAVDLSNIEQGPSFWEIDRGNARCWLIFYGTEKGWMIRIQSFMGIDILGGGEEELKKRRVRSGVDGDDDLLWISRHETRGSLFDIIVDIIHQFAWMELR